jgi:hypothetical protein
MVVFPKPLAAHGVHTREQTNPTFAGFVKFCGLRLENFTISCSYLGICIFIKYISEQQMLNSKKIFWEDSQSKKSEAMIPSLHRCTQGGRGRVNVVPPLGKFKTLYNKNAIKPEIGGPPRQFFLIDLTPLGILANLSGTPSPVFSTRVHLCFSLTVIRGMTCVPMSQLTNNPIFLRFRKNSCWTWVNTIL